MDSNRIFDLYQWNGILLDIITHIFAEWVMLNNWNNNCWQYYVNISNSKRTWREKKNLTQTQSNIFTQNICKAENNELIFIHSLIDEAVAFYSRPIVIHQSINCKFNYLTSTTKPKREKKNQIYIEYNFNNGDMSVMFYENCGWFRACNGNQTTNHLLYEMLTYIFFDKVVIKLNDITSSKHEKWIWEQCKETKEIWKLNSEHKEEINTKLLYTIENYKENKNKLYIEEFRWIESANDWKKTKDTCIWKLNRH